MNGALFPARVSMGNQAMEANDLKGALERANKQTRFRRIKARRPPTAHFEFLALPPELRNLIYTTIFVVYTSALDPDDPDSVRLEYLIEGTSRRLRYSLQRPFSQTSLSCTSYHAHRLKGPYLTVGILQTNQQVNHEASTVLYGANKFRFGSTTSMRPFLRRLGVWKKCLRHVELSGRWKWAYTSSAAARQCAAFLAEEDDEEEEEGGSAGEVALREVKFDFPALGWDGLVVRPGDLVRDFLPLFLRVWDRDCEPVQADYESRTDDNKKKYGVEEMEKKKRYLIRSTLSNTFRLGAGGENLVVDHEAMMASSRTHFAAGREPKVKFVELFWRAAEEFVLVAR